MQITHEQAHKLIQWNIDKVLSPQETSALSAHLQDCADCQSYAREIKEVERLLLPLLKRQWSQRPIPLSVNTLAKKTARAPSSNLLTTRRAAIGLVTMALFFSAWQFIFSGPAASSSIPPIAPSVPTPAAISTNTMMTLENCKVVVYRVQSHDTLASIAAQFSVSVAEIMEINNLYTPSLGTATELIIPICNFTPTSTVRPATFTITYTPIFQPTRSTPGPNG